MEKQEKKDLTILSVGVLASHLLADEHLENGEENPHFNLSCNIYGLLKEAIDNLDKYTTIKKRAALSGVKYFADAYEDELRGEAPPTFRLQEVPKSFRETHNLDHNLK